ncbi:MAG: hypothetical protein KAK00_00380 [Nanoarchaeota archaeon]|nr:hypothetical protein [Nanoarchaeota archaeon]
MGTALITIETCNDGQGTNIKYIPKNINQYTVVGVLRSLIKNIEEQNDSSSLKMMK